jgi:hypothetical protein
MWVAATCAVFSRGRACDTRDQLEHLELRPQAARRPQTTSMPPRDSAARRVRSDAGAFLLSSFTRGTFTVWWNSAADGLVRGVV